MAGDTASTGGPVLVGVGFRLVPPSPEHVPMLIALGQDEQSRRFGDAVPIRDETAGAAWVAVARERWADPHPWSPRQWVVEVEDDDDDEVWRAAGLVEYRPDGHGAAEVGYAIHPAHRGERLAARALDLALDHGFGTEDLQLVRWRAEVGHWTSRRVAWRLGFSAPQTVRGLLPGWGEDRAPRDGWIATLRHDEPREPGHAWLEPVVLTGDGVRLRPWRDDEDDAAALASVDEDVRTYVGPMLPGAGPEAVSTWLTSRGHGMANGTSLVWCIADEESDAALGLITLFDLVDPYARGTGQVGYWLLPAGRGRGAVTTALRLLSAHAFTELGLHRLGAATDERNEPSQRALERAGFRHLATQSQSCVYEQDGPRHDTLVYELLADDPLPSAPG